MTTSLRVVVVDDHPVVRAGVVALLSGAPDIEVVGECGDGTTALRFVSRRALTWCSWTCSSATASAGWRRPGAYSQRPRRHGCWC